MKFLVTEIPYYVECPLYQLGYCNPNDSDVCHKDMRDRLEGTECECLKVNNN